MSFTLQVAMLIAELIYFVLMIIFLKKKMLSLKYSLLWLIAGVLMVILTLFPGIIWRISSLIGIETPMNGLFAMMFFFVLTLMMSLTAIVSHQTEWIRSLTQSQALLEERIRELEEKK